MKLLRSLFILLYSLLFSWLLLPLVRLASALSPKLKTQVAGREPVPALAARLARDRAKKRRCVVFFCSSAGEFEQARPLIERLTALGDVYVQVIFFSQSGLDFVKARGESLPCCLSPVTDSVWHWGWLFSALRPDVVAVVRHELWPGFLDAARHYGRLYLIDASQSLGESRSRIKRLLRGQLLRCFDGIYTVSEADQAYFQERYGLGQDRVLVQGDTKYDRVRERALAKSNDIARLRQKLEGTLPSPGARRLVFGSAYRQEVELMLAARALLGEAAGRWQVVIVPHHVDPETVQWIRQRCAAAGLRTGLYSEMGQGSAPADVIILDAMGLLAEVYGTAEAAFVGGALHNQIHNVLEPACHGLALAWGPFYKNSQEAVHLATSGLAAVIQDPEELAAWWRRLDLEGGALAAKIVTAVAGLSGASDRIMAEWRPLLGA